MAVAGPELPTWFKSIGFEDYADILTKDLGVEEYDDFRLLRDEKDANGTYHTHTPSTNPMHTISLSPTSSTPSTLNNKTELLRDMSALKPMDDELKNKLKTEILKIICTQRSSVSVIINHKFSSDTKCLPIYKSYLLSQIRSMYIDQQR